MSFSGVLSVALFAALGSVAMAQTYPTKNIRLIVPFGAGTVTDLTGRFLGQRIAETLGQPVIVDNRPGANGVLGAQAAAAAPADGYTLMMGTNTTQAANLWLYKKLPYDPRRDFEPISNVVFGGIVLAVHPSMPVKNVPELVALSKKRAQKLNFGSGNSVTLVGMEQLKLLTGMDAVNVPYKSLPAVLTDVLGGHIDMAFGDTPTVMPFVRQGKLRVLGISTPQRMPAFPDVPTVAEQGVAGFEILGWLALFAPAKSPSAAVTRVNSTVVAALKSAEAAEFFGKAGWQTSPSTPAELGAFVRTEIERWGRMIKTAGIQPE